ncbi:MAG: TonB-dependent receptor, partial [Alloprevotella sp.]|nr:TonB-dependent receptor [Alloprevotella sp.]
LNQWKQPGDITNIPRFGYTNHFDTSLLHNASFCRMKNLSLSYDLPGKWMDATGFIRNVRLTAAARNLLTITKWKGADPETDSNVTKGHYPNTREFTLGIELTF